MGVFQQPARRTEMAERDPIDLIRDQLNGIEGLIGLHVKDERFKQWHEETRMILEKAFSPKSIHCQSFLALRFQEMGKTPFASPEIDKINAGRYKRDLENVKNVLQGAIKELTLDRTLFKKIQTTPQSVEVTLKGDYYVSSGIDHPGLLQSIHMAFEGCGLNPLHGEEVPFQQRIDRIKRSQFGIYDLSNVGKPDVWLEIGAALAMGKKVYPLCKRGASLPEAIQSFDRIEYDDFPSLTEKLKKSLKI